jgi:hypothetical protein
MQLDTISSEYITLAFALEQHIAGFVDAYFGPDELRQAAKDAALRPPQDLVAAIAELRRQVQAVQATGDASYPHRRGAYLDLQLRAMETTARKLAGEPLAYRDEVQLLFDIVPSQTPETVFEQAIADLDATLPGSGPVAERMEAWKQQFEVAPDTARRMIDRIATEARTRTQARYRLPDSEAVTFDLVQDKPWSGYNWYLGHAHSRIEMNTDLPVRADTLLDLVCHEGYPGHHTEHALKEQILYRERGWGEQAIQLINTPECVISEGIATLAADVIFGDEAAAWAAAEVYPLGAIKGDPEREECIATARRLLRALGGNAALLLYEQNADPEEVVRYIMRYGLRTEREARQQLRFIQAPLWRAYVFTYHAGRDLLNRWIERGDKQERFRTLLTEQVYPSLIEQWVLEEDKHCLNG